MELLLRVELLVSDTVASEDLETVRSNEDAESECGMGGADEVELLVTSTGGEHRYGGLFGMGGTGFDLVEGGGSDTEIFGGLGGGLVGTDDAFSSPKCACCDSGAGSVSSFSDSTVLPVSASNSVVFVLFTAAFRSISSSSIPSIIVPVGGSGGGPSSSTSSTSSGLSPKLTV